jgi:hypothetical protein
MRYLNRIAQQKSLKAHLEPKSNKYNFYKEWLLNRKRNTKVQNHQL